MAHSVNPIELAMRDPVTVADLKEFPFETFDSYRVASEVGTARLGFDSQFGIEWFLSKAGATSRAISYLLMVAPFVTDLCFVVYLFRHNAWLLSGLPLLVVAYYTTHPATLVLRNLFSPLVLLADFLTFVVALFLLWSGHYPGVTRLFVAMIAIGLFNHMLQARMVRAIVRKSRSDEDFLCMIWSHGLANVMFADGTTFRYHPPAGDN